MSMESSLRSFVLADATLAALVDVRVYANRAPQNPTYPLVVFKRKRTDRDYGLQGPHDLIMPDYEFVVESDDYMEARTANDALVALLDRYSGVMGDKTVTNIHWVDDYDDYDDKLEIHKVVTKFSLWYT